MNQYLCNTQIESYNHFDLVAKAEQPSVRSLLTADAELLRGMVPLGTLLFKRHQDNSSTVTKRTVLQQIYRDFFMLFIFEPPKKLETSFRSGRAFAVKPCIIWPNFGRVIGKRSTRRIVFVGERFNRADNKPSKVWCTRSNY